MYQYNPTRPTTEFLFDVAKGNIWDTTAVNIFGFNRTVGTSFETIWNNGATYAYPSSAVAMSVASSASGDTGLQVKITGLDANYAEVSETLTTDGSDGTTAVTGSVLFYRINSAIILNGNATGNISITNGGTTYAYIEATLGTTQSSVYSVPAGHSLYLFRIDVNSATANGNQYLVIRNIVTNSAGRTLKVAEATFSDSQVSYDRQVPFKIAEKTDFHFEAKSSAASNEIAIFIEAILVRD